MKPLVRNALWAAGLVAVFFVGFGIFRLIHMEDSKLHADVSQSSTSIIVKNIETVDWAQCVATLHQGSSAKLYKSRSFDVSTGQEHSFPLTDFTADDGLRFDPHLYTSKEIDLQCGPAGRYRTGRFGRK